MNRTRQGIKESLLRFLERCGDKYRTDVVLFGRPIDVAFVSAEKVHSVECRVSAWRKAASLAENHRVGADFSWVCVPKMKVGADFEAQLKKFGVGPMLVDGETVEVFVEALQSRPSRLAREKIKEHIEEARNEGTSS